MRTNYVMIDFESVQPSDLALLDAEHFRVKAFVGANQTRIATDFAEAMQGLGSRAEYVRISGSGRNALDFHIAFHIGLIAAAERDVFFHVISKDTGFDPLITHLKGRKVFAARSAAIADIPILKAPAAAPLCERTSAVITDLQRRGAARPKTVRTLMNTISSMFQKQLAEEEVRTLFDGLVNRRIVRVDGESVSYQLGVRAA